MAVFLPLPQAWGEHHHFVHFGFLHDRNHFGSSLFVRPSVLRSRISLRPWCCFRTKPPSPRRGHLSDMLGKRRRRKNRTGLGRSEDLRTLRIATAFGDSNSGVHVKSMKATKKRRRGDGVTKAAKSTRRRKGINYFEHLVTTLLSSTTRMHDLDHGRRFGKLPIL